MEEKNFKEELTYDEIIKLLKPVIDSIEKERYDNDCLEKPKNLPESKFSNMIFSKLNSILRKQKFMSEIQALNYYTSYDIIHAKVCEILDLIDYINNIGNVIYIIDKQTICAYLRINVQTFQVLLTDSTVDDEVRQEFKNLEELLISSIQQGAEIKIRDNQATARRLSMEGEFGGNDVQFHKRKESNIINGVIDENELMKKLETTYNFIGMLEKNKKN